jgi:hypothetical protein
MDNIKIKCMDILSQEGINPASEIDFDVNGEVYSLSFDYIIDTYMQASDESKLVFLEAMRNSLDTKDFMGIEKFFEGMGKLLLMTHLSQKI